MFEDAADRTAGIKIELFRDAALTQFAADYQVLRRANMPWENNRHPFPIGSSSVYGSWFDNESPTNPFPFNNPSNRPLYLALIAIYTCSTADFNNDGESGNDADIESFFRVLAGGAC